MIVRFKKTDKGEIAILPRKEYEVLVSKVAKVDEDMKFARLVARAHKKIRFGTLLVPKEIVDRIANGENALRVLRTWRNMTVPDLSIKVHVGEDYISDMECGRRKGSISALKKIAVELKVPHDLLV